MREERGGVTFFLNNDLPTITSQYMVQLSVFRIGCAGAVMSQEGNAVMLRLHATSASS